MELTLEMLQNMASIIMLIAECEEMADNGASPKAITEMLRIGCKFYGKRQVCQELNNSKKLLKYLSK